MKKQVSIYMQCLLGAMCLVLCFSLQAWAKDFLYVPVNNHMHVISCETDSIIKTISYNDYIVGCTSSPDGTRLYLNTFHKIYEFSTESDEIVDVHEFHTDLNRVTIPPDMEVSADGRYLYFSTSITKKKMNIPRLNVIPPQLIIYDLQKKKVVKNFEIPTAMNGIYTIKDDPNHLILAGQDLIKINLENGKYEKLMGFLHPEEGAPPLNALVIWDLRSPGGNGISLIPVYSPTDMYYIIIDTNTGQVRRLKGEDLYFAYSAMVSPDKKYIYGVMDELYKVDFETGKTVDYSVVPKGTCYSMAMTSDGKKLYAGPAGPDLTIYDTEAMEPLGTIPLKGDGLYVMRISK